MKNQTFLLNLSTKDAPGIVSAVSTQIMHVSGNITESHQYLDPETKLFFMRTAFRTEAVVSIDVLYKKFSTILQPLGINFTITSPEKKPRIIIMVSKFDHAMHHLLYQIKVGWLKAEVVAIVSNHEITENKTEINGIPFFYLPVSKLTKNAQEEKLINIIDELKVDLVVLARYMQILSENLCQKLSKKAINIHHSFLPAFKGANPYSRAHEKGVKLMGATAHYITSDLDEGPIIEQDTRRISHAATVGQFVADGREVESRVLAYAVKMHLEHRVMINGSKTVIFS